jgi:hypothetical protein
VLKKTSVVVGAMVLLSLAAPAHAEAAGGQGLLAGPIVGPVNGPLVAPIVFQLPINPATSICGISLPLFGEAISGCKGGAGVHNQG